MSVPSRSQSTPMLILDAEDSFERARGFRGKHPRPSGVVRFFLMARTERGASRPALLPKPLEMQTVENSDGFRLFFGNLIMPDRNVKRIDADRWPWTIRAAGDYYQVLDVTSEELPSAFGGNRKVVDAAIKFDLQPGPLYPFPYDSPKLAPILVRGTLRSPDGHGLPGVRIAVLDPTTGNENQRAISSADGQWVLVLPSAPSGASIDLRFTEPGGGHADIKSVQVRPGIDNNIAQTVLRGRVQKGAKGVKEAKITVDKVSGSAYTGDKGDWAFYLRVNQPAGKVKVTAILPAGSAKSSVVEVQPRETVVVPTFDFS